MDLSVIIIGAGGRMGATLTRLVRETPGYALAGVVERKERCAGLETLGCPVAHDIAELLPSYPDATIIDFTAPEASLAAARLAAQSGNAAVIGTTGLSAEQQGELRNLATKTRIFWSPNMSIGINALVRILPRLERILGETYDMEIAEIHHRNKKDAPSGTALRLAQALADSRGWNLDDVGNFGRHGLIGARPDKEIGVQALRGGDVVGDHTVYFLGQGERLELTHRAHSRDNFARGALRAAAWLREQRPGKLYSMDEMLGE